MKRIAQRIACVWLPNWPIQRLAAEHEGSAERCVLLFEARANGGLKIVACSEAAMKSGVRVEMSLAEALSLTTHAPTNDSPSACGLAIPQPHDPLADRQSLTALATWCQQFSPIVGLENTERPESLLLDVTGLANIFGSEQQLAKRLIAAFAARHLHIRIAIADTIGAAWALAHFCKSQISNRKSDLSPLPLAALRLPPQTALCLEELGLERIEQLLPLPRETLSSRFGNELLLRLDQATGIASEAIIAHKLPPEFQAEWLFEHATDRRETIDFVLETLAARLTAQLAARREGVLRLECRLDLQAGEPLRFSIGLYRASASPKHLLELLSLQLEDVRLREPVIAARLVATATGPLAMEQQGLFAEEQSRTSPRHLAALIDRLASRLGRDAVLRPTPLADAQPEHACQYLPLAGGVRRKSRSERVSEWGSERRRKKRASANPSLPHSLTPSLWPQRPIRLREPQQLAVMSIVPDGPPIHFRVANRDERVLNTWGPERIETGWWRASAGGSQQPAASHARVLRAMPVPLGIRRDYYRVETKSGRGFWLFRRLGDQRWFCHGTFE